MTNFEEPLPGSGFGVYFEEPLPGNGFGVYFEELTMGKDRLTAELEIFERFERTFFANWFCLLKLFDLKVERKFRFGDNRRL